MKKNIFALLLLLLPLAAFCQDGSLRLKDKFQLNDTVRIEEIADTSYVIWGKNGAICYNKEDASIFKSCELEMKEGEPLRITILLDSVWGTLKKGQQQSDTLLYIRHYFLKDSILQVNDNDTLMMVVDNNANSVLVYSVGGKTTSHAENKPSWLVWLLGGIVVAAIIMVVFVFDCFKLFRKKTKSKKFTVKLTTNDIADFKSKADDALGEKNYKIGKKRDKITFTISMENVQKIKEKDFVEVLKKNSKNHADGKKIENDKQKAKNKENKKNKGKHQNNNKQPAQVAPQNYDPTIDKVEKYVNSLTSIKEESATENSLGTTSESENGTRVCAPNNGGNVEKDEISQLNKKLKEYEKIIEEFQRKRGSDSTEQSEKAAVQTNQGYIDAINDVCEFLRSLINEKGKVKELDTRIETIKKELKEQNVALEKEKQTLITKNECLEKLIKRVQDDPESFKGDADYNKLTKVIERAEKCDDICKYPDSIDEDTEVGKLIKKAKLFAVVLNDPEKLLNVKETHNLTDVVRKGLLLDKVKKVPDLIASDKEFAQTPLQDFIVFIDSPEKISKHNNLSSKGLYKLVDGIMQINKNPGLQSATYPWLNTMLSKAMENSSQYIHVQNAASSFGNSSDLSALTGQVQTIFQYAKSYLQFADYKNYWKNLQSPLLTALNQLPSRNEIDNMRVLLFYVSQLYSMTCIMGKIYGDSTQTTSNHVLNVAVFNSTSTPTPGSLGFPSTAEASFKDFTFQYLNAPGEVEMIHYLKKYKPLPFIFLNSYYDNSVLS